MKRFESAYGLVVLTGEREQHILEFHPDVRSCLQYFAATLKDPELVVPSKHDLTVIIHYRFLPRRKKYLAVVVKIKPRPFVITAYLAKKPKQDRLSSI